MRRPAGIEIALGNWTTILIAGSIGVHTRCGFRMIGTHPNVGLKFGRWLDTVMMQRELGEGARTVPGK